MLSAVSCSCHDQCDLCDLSIVPKLAIKITGYNYKVSLLYKEGTRIKYKSLRWQGFALSLSFGWINQSSHVRCLYDWASYVESQQADTSHLLRLWKPVSMIFSCIKGRAEQTCVSVWLDSLHKSSFWCGKEKPHPRCMFVDLSSSQDRTDLYKGVLISVILFSLV